MSLEVATQNTLPVKKIPSDEILITECLATKEKLDVAFWKKTRTSVIGEIRSILNWDGINKAKIPPIVALKVPDIFTYSDIDGILAAILKSKWIEWDISELYKDYVKKAISEWKLVCYNWNTRLEAFQSESLDIATYVVDSDESFWDIPEHEKIDPNRFWELYSNYAICYLHLLTNALDSEVNTKYFTENFCSI